MSKLFLSMCLATVVGFSSFAHAHSEENINLDSTPDIKGWGFDIGFGNQSYMTHVTRIGVLSPFLFSGGHSDWRLTADVVGKTLQAFTTKSILEYSLSLEANSRIYKDIAYSYAKFGLGLMDMDNDLYRGNVFILPITLGLQVITANTKRSVLSFFVEYRFIAYNDYDIKKSLPKTPNVGIDKTALFQGTTSFGLRLLF